MPKLDALQTADRLQKQLDKLIEGEEVAKRDLLALLSKEQAIELEKAWQQQQVLRSHKRARTDEEQKALGWQTKREVQIEVLKKIVTNNSKNEVEDLKNLLKHKELRQAKIFMKKFSKARANQKNFWSAWAYANNELVRAGLSRVDGQRTEYMSKRDKEVREMEEQILAKIYSEMTEEEREQYDMLNEIPKSDKKRRSK